MINDVVLRRRSSPVPLARGSSNSTKVEEGEIAPKLSRTESLTKDLKNAIFGSIQFEVHDMDKSAVKEGPDGIKEEPEDLESSNDSVKPFVCNICTSAYLSKS